MGQKNKVAGKSAFYKRTRRSNPGMANEAIRVLWEAKKAAKASQATAATVKA